MSKSPLNFGLFGGVRDAVRSKRSRKKLAGRINKLENQVGVLMKDRHESVDPVEMGTQQPMYATSVQGDVADNVIQANDLAEDQLANQGIQPLNAFSPETQDAAGAMFGSSIPGSFDRSMEENPLARHRSGHKKPQWKIEQEAKFEAEKAAHKAEKARLLELTRKRREKIYGTDQSSWGK